MPESTNLNVSPYFQDYDPNSQYMQILFQPGVSVQVRELNNLQAQLQNQIEQFGDNILATGTIVSGCTFQFYPDYPYVKLRDLDLFNNTVVPADLRGLFAQSVNTGLSAFITNSADGAEATSPDFKTVFVTYINGGFDGNTHIFNPGETLLITDANTSIWSVNVVSSSIAFSNADFPVFTPALIVNVTSGSFTVGDFVTQPSTGANLQVTNIDSTTLALAGQSVLYLNPRNVDLANAQVNANAWTVANDDIITNSGNTGTGTVVAVVGNSAAGSILTDGSGRILEVPLAFGGYGYELLPTVAVRSINNTVGLAGVSLLAQNFFTKLLVANTSDAVGNGYAFGVGAGTIYQKGFFLKVLPQTIVIDKYDTGPNNISVGFFSSESIVTPTDDPTLFDNTQDTINTQSPGANRLKIVPTLTTTHPTASQDVLQLVVWSEGNPVVVRQDTSYGELGKELARRTFEASGDFSLDQFNITTRSVNTASFEGNTFSLVVDPGLAYVRGYRVATERNFVISDRKGTDVNTIANVSISLNYDDWIPIANIGGTFQFSTGDTVNFYDTAKGFLGNTSLVATSNIVPQGSLIGTARMRSLVPATIPTAQPGDPNAQYYLYLFAINMNQGHNLKDVKAVQYQGTNQNANGIADVVLVSDQSTNTNICKFGNTLYDTLVFGTGWPIQEVANARYTYRTFDQTLSFANTGRLSKTLTGSEYWPYANGTGLNQASLLQQYVVPTGGNMQAAVNVAGTVTVNLTSNIMVGSSTTFSTSIVPGDWVYIFSNSTVSDIRRVMFVANNTRIQLDANATIDQTGCGLFRYFPQYVPIPFGVRSGMAGNVDASGQVLTLDLGLALSASVSCNAALATDVNRIGIPYGTKTAARDNWVVIKCSNAAGGTTGPWSLGVSDTMRLKQVVRLTGVAPPYTNTTLTTSGHDVTGSFYIDQHQTQDYVDLSYLCLEPQSEVTLGTTDYLAVRFDAFQVTNPGFFVQPSYVSANMAYTQAVDSLSLGNLGANISSFEIPIAVNQKGEVYDLSTHIDFRPIVANTAVPTTNVTAASINPTTTISFGNTAHPANDFKFPHPDSTFTADVTRYMGRVDGVFLTHDTEISVLTGQPGNRLGPNKPSNTMTLGSVVIPPYPNLPQYISNTVGEVITLRTLNNNKKLAPRTIRTPGSSNTVFPDQPKRYNMAEIGQLATRIRNLEYYVSLSALQTDMVNKVIPSGVDPSIDRFKYGLFIDNFSSAISQDVNDPQYAASIVHGMLTPPFVSWVIRHGFGAMLNRSYIDYPIIQQPIATAPGTVAPPTAVVNAAVGWLLRVDADTILPGSLTSGGSAATVTPSVNLIDYETVTFANVAGAANFYIFVPNTPASIQRTFGINYQNIPVHDPDAFTIYQGNTQLLTAYSNAAVLTNTDITFLQSNTVPAGWFKTTALQANTLVKSGNSFVTGSMKVSWTHNPLLGNQYTIKSQRLNTYDHWRWALQYPAIAPTIPAPQILTSGAVSYSGVMVPEPTTFLLQIFPPAPFTSVGGGISASGILNLGSAITYGRGTGPTQNRSQTAVDFTGSSQVIHFDQNTIVSGAFNGFGRLVNTTLIPQGFNFVVYGLKPNTKHTFSAAGVDQSAFVMPFGGSLGDDLVTDALGMLDFDYFYTGTATQQSITSTLLSNTAPIQTAANTWLSGVTEQPLGDGTIMFEVVAPNSLAQFPMAVGASPTIPLNLLKNRNTIG